jgi:hypothetical protein
MRQAHLIKLSLTILLTSLLAGCFSDNDDNSLIPFEGMAVVQSTDDSNSMIEFTDGKNIVESRFLGQTATDYAVFANGEYFYQLGKFDIDTIQKYHIDNPQVGYYANDGYSLREAGDTTSSNPHNIVFLKDDANTAIITRYNSTESWVVNLNAASSEDFIITKLNLSHHTTTVIDTDNDPEASMAYISNGKLFITLQNLDGYTATANALVAVFDTNTWEEIDTNSSIEGVQGISLTLKNHQAGAIFDGKIYLGSLVYGTPSTGGIEVINTSTLKSSVITDQLAVNNITVNGQGRVFFTDYAAWQSNSLYVLNNDNSYSPISSDLSGINITMLASPGDSIWIGTNTFDSENQILRLNSTLDYTEEKLLNDIVLSKVTMALKPISIGFLDTDPNKLTASK